MNENFVTLAEYQKIQKWYYSPLFAIFLSFWWPLYFIPLIIAIILQIKRKRIIKKILAVYYPIIDNETLFYEILDMEDKYTSLKSCLSNLKKEYADKSKVLKENLQNEEIEIKNSLALNVKDLKIEIEDLKNKKDHLLEELETLNSEVVSMNFDFSSFDDITSEEFKNHLSISKLNEEKDLKDGKLITIKNTSFDKKFLSNNSKQVIRLFNAECEAAMSKVTAKNIDSTRNKITRSYNSLNKIFETDGIQINECWLQMKLDQLNTLYLYETKKTQEKEIQKAIKEQMIEEEKVRREIEKQKAKLEKDQKQFNNEVTRMMKYLQKTSNDAEKELYLDKIKELEEKIKTLEKEKNLVLEREANAKAGFVYIISNIGSFGEGVYKIGMTRRLEPMDRIKELSSASVPFEFDVHAMIFSENAPELENILHQTFKEKSVNKINYRKEFFKVSLDEIEEVIKQNYDKTVDFIRIPDAIEYRQTLELEKNI